MEKTYKNFNRAFRITTKGSNYCDCDTYIVLAPNFSEAEKVYWETLNGYYPIISIETIDAEKVGFSEKFNEE
jgi:hypothetical protein